MQRAPEVRADPYRTVAKAGALKWIAEKRFALSPIRKTAEKNLGRLSNDGYILKSID
jgi:hypothetical protein